MKNAIINFGGKKYIRNTAVSAILGYKTTGWNYIMKNAKDNFIKGQDYNDVLIKDILNNNPNINLGNPGLQVRIWTIEGIKKLKFIDNNKKRKPKWDDVISVFATEVLSVNDSRDSNGSTSYDLLSAKLDMLIGIQTKIEQNQHTIINLLNNNPVSALKHTEKIKETIQDTKSTKNRAGRPFKEMPENFPELYTEWKNKKIETKQIIAELNLSINTFYRMGSRYEAENGNIIVESATDTLNNEKHKNKLPTIEEFGDIFRKYKNKEMTKSDMMQQLGISSYNYYKLRTEYMANHVISKFVVDGEPIVDGYIGFRRIINDGCKEVYSNKESQYKTKNAVLNAAYYYLQKEYGICWHQYRKEFIREKDKKPASNMELAYWIEYSNPSCRNMLICAINSLKTQYKQKVRIVERASEANYQ